MDIINFIYNIISSPVSWMAGMLFIFGYEWIPKTEADEVIEEHINELQVKKVDKNTVEVNINDYASFSAAIDDIGANQKTLLINKQSNVTANKTVPANVTLRFIQGGSLNISNGITATINGDVDAGLYTIFEWTGTGKVDFGDGSVKEVFPEWWGIDGTDDDIEIQKAITAFAVVSLSKKTYTTSSALILESNTCLIGAGIDSSIIYGETVTDDILRAVGTLGATQDLVANADRGDRIVVLVGALACAKDDLLLLESDDIYSNNPANMYRAEIVRVFSVAGVNVTLTNAILDNYLIANGAKLTIINAVSQVKLEGFSVLGNPILANKNANSIRFTYVDESIINDVKCSRTPRTGMTFQACHNIRVTKPIIHDIIFDLTGWSDGYGLQAYDASRDIVIEGAHVENVQHAVTIGGTKPCRFIRIKGGYFSGYGGSNPLDVHGGTEIYFEGSTVMGSCGVANGTIVFRDCDIHSDGNVHCIKNRSLSFLNLTVDGCRLFVNEPDVAYGAVIEALIWVTYDTSDYLNIKNTEFHLPGLVPNLAVIYSAANKTLIHNNKVFADQAGVKSIHATVGVALLSLGDNYFDQCDTLPTILATDTKIEPVFGIPAPLTIAGNIITINFNKNNYILTPQAGAVDDLSTINGGYDGMLLILSGDGTFQIDIKHNIGNILISGGADYLLPTTTERILLQYDATLTKWIGFPGF